MGSLLVVFDSSRDARPFARVRKKGQRDSSTLPAVSALTSLAGVQRSTLVVFDSSRRFGSSTKGVRDTSEVSTSKTPSRGSAIH